MTARVVVGLMSGTSLDGISAAVARFSDSADGRIEVELLAYTSHPYTTAQRSRLGAALGGGTPAEYCRLNFDLGGWLAEAAIEVMAEAGVARDDISAIASHGQTIWHEPGHSTWQTGEASVIAERTGIDVVSDFRVRDVAAGGQGAPLVSAADAMLFASGSEWRGLQNLGGIGNITVVPPHGEIEGVRAFDTGPGVAVIDGVTHALRPDLSYDVDGKLASAGQPSLTVVQELMAAPYFESPPPKSTGRELFNTDYFTKLIARCRADGASDGDIIATAVQLTAESVGDAYRRFIPEPITEVLVSGGGARNPVLFAAIVKAAAPIRVRHFDEVYFDGEAKEAVAFALLGYLHVTRRPGNVPTATGARGQRILGKLTPA
ncbi:MAG TPA: anhydro-N-acetylmuramic acid kinase [Gemmatimonadaceae bacterium]|jgi:anhydro-N-acetylmuramic acid kinase|nr:anhydro-N-acetylmuramic acid kinase [Gemmatimonadaceae bacterium]